MGMSSRIRVAVEYLRAEVENEAPIPLNKVTVIREQVAGFPNGTELPLFGRLDMHSFEQSRLYTGTSYLSRRKGVVSAEETAEALPVDSVLLSAWGFDLADAAGWHPASPDGAQIHPTAQSSQQIACLPGRLVVCAPDHLVTGQEHAIYLRWFPADQRMYVSKCCFQGPDPNATGIQLEVHFSDLTAQG